MVLNGNPFWGRKGKEMNRLEQVSPWKLAKAYARVAAEVAVCAVVVFYTVTFMTHTLTQYGQTYSQVFTEHKQHTTLWENFCKTEMERHNHVACEQARKYLAVNPYGRIIHTVVQDMPILGVCGKHENCWMAAAEALAFFFNWARVIQLVLVALSCKIISETIYPHWMGAARLTKTFKTARRDIAAVPVHTD